MTPKTGSKIKKPILIRGIDLGADALEKDLQTILSKQEKVCIALSGGRSAEKFYPTLKKKLGRLTKNLELFLLDERLSTNHRNSIQIRNTLGDIKLHTLGSGKKQQLLRQYNQELKKSCNGRFDLIIAGVGEDGHIASLFPNSKQLNYKNRGYIRVDDSPKSPKQRLSASPTLITQAKFIYLLFIGKAKQAAFVNLMDKNVSITECPAKLALKSSVKIITDINR